MKVLAFVGMLIGGRYLLRPVSVLLQLLVCGKCSPPRRCCCVGFRIVYGCAGVVDGARYVIAGVLLAESEYRHELETAIDPSKACCLVCSLSLSACRSTWGALYPSVVGSDKCGCAGGGKILVLYLLARLYGVRSSERISLLAC